MNIIIGLRFFIFVSVFNQVVSFINSEDHDVKWFQDIGNTNVDKLKATEKAVLSQNYGWILVPVDLDRKKRSIDDNKGNLKRLSHSVHVQSDIRYR